jgi:hypothetical protein
MKALINKLKALLCSYICRPDEHENVSECGAMPEISEVKK